MTEEKFHEKISMIVDPYFDREFFTNLIYCMDRDKSIRQIFEACFEQLSESPEISIDLDKSLLQMLYAFSATSMVRETYQWLPLFQALYSASLLRSNGQKPIAYQKANVVAPRASTVAEFTDLIRRETRSVESPERAWSSLMFLLDNRTTRSQTVATLLGYAVLNADALTLELLVKSIDVAMACGWRSNSIILKRAFERFWANPKPLQVVAQGWRVSKALTQQEKDGELVWKPEWAEDLWTRLTTQSVESAWEGVDKAIGQGAKFEQIFVLLGLLRGRCLFSMKSEQWHRVAASLFYGDTLASVARWCPEIQVQLLAASLCELSKLTQIIGTATPLRPTGAQVLDGTSKNISKDRLILRLDDVVERGERFEALEIMSVILKDSGLSQTVCDRLVLMASKQDGWTFDQKTIGLATILTKIYDSALRLQMSGPALQDSIYGLLRFLSDQREASLEVVQKTGTYGDRMKPSQYDVSGGARIVDRYVFNQARNAQRVKIWPSDN